MTTLSEQLPDGTLHFLPNRLNRQPVIVLGMTADELWLSVGLSALVGLVGSDYPQQQSKNTCHLLAQRRTTQSSMDYVPAGDQQQRYPARRPPLLGASTPSLRNRNTCCCTSNGR
ncbi:DUF3487 family protein [Pseudomonas caspiana]|uniref:DUF3487 family protein n=1 Tax=Pseudomonas caspiana TaxID=1451454 RepID=UPI0032EB2BE5